MGRIRFVFAVLVSFMLTSLSAEATEFEWWDKKTVLLKKTRQGNRSLQLEVSRKQPAWHAFLNKSEEISTACSPYMHDVAFLKEYGFLLENLVQACKKIEDSYQIRIKNKEINILSKEEISVLSMIKNVVDSAEALKENYPVVLNLIQLLEIQKIITNFFSVAGKHSVSSLKISTLALHDNELEKIGNYLQSYIILLPLIENSQLETKNTLICFMQKYIYQTLLIKNFSQDDYLKRASKTDNEGDSKYEEEEIKLLVEIVEICHQIPDYDKIKELQKSLAPLYAILSETNFPQETRYKYKRLTNSHQ